MKMRMSVAALAGLLATSSAPAGNARSSNARACASSDLRRRFRRTSSPNTSPWTNKAYVTLQENNTLAIWQLE